MKFSLPNRDSRAFRTRGFVTRSGRLVSDRSATKAEENREIG